MVNKKAFRYFGGFLKAQERWLNRMAAQGFRLVRTTRMMYEYPGSYNKELLIVEKRKDGKPFELHTDPEDLVRYYQSLRNAYLFNGIFWALCFLLNFFMRIPVAVNVLLGVFSVIYLVPAIFYALAIHHVNEDRKIYE